MFTETLFISKLCKFYSEVVSIWNKYQRNLWYFKIEIPEVTHLHILE